MAAPGEDEGSLVRTLKDLFAGAVGGVAQVLIGEDSILREELKQTLILISRSTVRYRALPGLTVRVRGNH